MIQMKNIHKSFGEQTVLNGVSFHVPQGSVTCIMGPSGTGKSVTLKLLLGLLKPDSGQVIVDGEDTTFYTESKMLHVRKKFGMLFQDAALFDDMNVYENISFPLREHTNLSEKEMIAKVKEGLFNVGLSDIEHKMPSELSGGMRKRVGLARALMLDPKIILFDEPTTGLDPITTYQISELIRTTHMRYPATFLIISHDLALSYRIADHMYMLYQGHVVEHGTPKEFQSSTHPFVREFLDAQRNLECGI